MPKPILFAAAAAVCCLVNQSVIRAADEAPADYDALIKQLDAETFSEREDASKALQAAGPAAFGALEKAAAGDSREAATRAVEILKRHFEGDNEQLQSAAKKSLETIAAGNGASARRAKNVLEPPPQNPAGGLGGIQIVPGIQIQVIGNAGGRRVSVRTVNGVKEIEAEEDGQKVKILDDPQNGIKMEIISKKDGKETTEKFEAKDENELKKKHPEAHKIYEKYGKQQGGIQIRGLQIQGRQVPALPIRPGGIRQLLPRKSAKEAAEKIEETRKQLDETIERLRQQQGDELKKAVEELEAAQARLEEVQQQLDPK